MTRIGRKVIVHVNQTRQASARQIDRGCTGRDRDARRRASRGDAPAVDQDHRFTNDRAFADIQQLSAMNGRRGWERRREEHQQDRDAQGYKLRNLSVWHARGISHAGLYADRHMTPHAFLENLSADQVDGNLASWRDASKP